ncbi:hypothetical protein ACJX0J_008841 [Zea mays]
MQHFITLHSLDMAIHLCDLTLNMMVLMGSLKIKNGFSLPFLMRKRPTKEAYATSPQQRHGSQEQGNVNNQRGDLDLCKNNIVTSVRESWAHDISLCGYILTFERARVQDTT